MTSGSAQSLSQAMGPKHAAGCVAATRLRAATSRPYRAAAAPAFVQPQGYYRQPTRDSQAPEEAVAIPIATWVAWPDRDNHITVRSLMESVGESCCSSDLSSASFCVP